MRRSHCLAVRGLLVAACLFVLFTVRGRSADDEDKTAKDVIKLADALAKKDAKTADPLAKGIAKATKRDDLMNLLGPTDQGGFGVGPKKESFELKIDILGKKGISKDEFAKQKDDLKRMAELTVAISHVSEHYADKAGNAKKVALWKMYNADFQAKSRELLDAIAKDNVNAIKGSATKLSGTCIACHKDFK